jgi:hypothetical protein
MVLKQKGKPEKGKKPLRGQPREFTDHREFPDGPREEEEQENEETFASSDEDESSASEVERPNGLSTSSQPIKKAPASNAPKELSRRDREAIQKEQARQHYMKMKEKEDGARLALVRKQREEAAAAHAEALKGTTLILVNVIYYFL